MQLANAVKTQENNTIKIGQLAKNKNLLTQTHIKKILRLQKEKDIYFEEAAQKLGFLTSKQIAELLEEQKSIKVCIGEVLVKLGYITKEALHRELICFFKEQDAYIQNTRKNYPEQLKYEKLIIDEFSYFTIKSLQRIVGIIAKYDHCENKKNEFKLLPMSIIVNFSGFFSNHICSYIFMTNTKLANIIATAVSGTPEIILYNSSVRQVVADLVNNICKQACHKLSTIEQLSASAPEKIKTTHELYSKYILDNNKKAAWIQLLTPFGHICFVIVFSNLS